MQTFSQYSDLIGMVGVIITLAAYYLLNINKLSSIDRIYLIMNFVGSSLVLLSLCVHWNLSAGVIEGAWALISLLGLYRVMKGRKQLDRDEEG